MLSESSFTGNTLFQMSRIGSVSSIEDIQLHADIASHSGTGVRLFTNCNDSEISMWCPEQTWCSWLMPQLSTTGLNHIEEELRPLIASWTLAPLNRWLEKQRLPNLVNANAEACSGDTSSTCWRLTFIQGARRLPIYLDKVPPELLDEWLAALEPSNSQKHTFKLILGWCFLPLDEIGSIVIGDALPIIGVGDDLDHFWLHNFDISEQLQLKDNERGVVISSPYPCGTSPNSIVRLIVEAGSATIDSTTLANWIPGREVSLSAHSHILLQLRWQENLWAQGTLIRLDDGWAVLIVSLDKAGRSTSRDITASSDPINVMVV